MCSFTTDRNTHLTSSRGPPALASTNGGDDGDFVSFSKQKELISKLDIFLTHSQDHLVPDISQPEGKQVE